MREKIERVALFPNDNEQSLAIAQKVKNILEQYHFQVVEDSYDLAIAIGGDGSFLRMLKKTAFNSDIYYVGINTGTLGFLQEIKPDEIELLISRIENQNFYIGEMEIQETTVKMGNKEDSFYSLNEIVIRDQDLNTLPTSILVDDVLLEQFRGDGILVSTSIGSTAYNLSYGGSIVYGSLHTLQITPIAPLNSKAYKTLTNSVIIPENKTIQFLFTPSKNRLILTVDGANKFYQEVQEVTTKIASKKIYCIRMEEYNDSNIIYEKFLK